jgi:hypothetical protein
MRSTPILEYRNSCDTKLAIGLHIALHIAFELRLWTRRAANRGGALMSGKSKGLLTAG